MFQEWSARGQIFLLVVLFYEVKSPSFSLKIVLISASFGQPQIVATLLINDCFVLFVHGRFLNMLLVSA